jgi:hypothetical protein
MVVSIAEISKSNPIDIIDFRLSALFMFQKFRHRTLTRVPHERVNERNFHPTQQNHPIIWVHQLLIWRLKENFKSKIIYFTFYNVQCQGTSNVTCRTNLLRSHQLEFLVGPPNIIICIILLANHGKKDG